MHRAPRGSGSKNLSTARWPSPPSSRPPAALCPSATRKHRLPPPLLRQVSSLTSRLRANFVRRSCITHLCIDAQGKEHKNGNLTVDYDYVHVRSFKSPLRVITCPRSDLSSGPRLVPFLVSSHLLVALYFPLTLVPFQPSPPPLSSDNCASDSPHRFRIFDHLGRAVRPGSRVRPQL